METKLTVIPFDLGKAKMIQGRINSARIITRAGRNVRAVVFNMKNDTTPIAAIVTINDEGRECVRQYRETGKIREPYEDENDLMLMVPDYLTFEFGDVIACEHVTTDYVDVMALKRINGNLDLEFIYCASDEPGSSCRYNEKQSIDQYKKIRYATDEEKLMAAYKVTQLKVPVQKAINSEQQCKSENQVSQSGAALFEPFQKILARQPNGVWTCDLFSNTEYDDEEGCYIYFGISGIGYDECVPYNDETKHLIGTILDYKE